MTLASYVKGEARQSLKRVFYAYLACALNSLTAVEKVPLFECPIHPFKKFPIHSNFFEGLFRRTIEKVVRKIQYKMRSAVIAIAIQ